MGLVSGENMVKYTLTEGLGLGSELQAQHGNAFGRLEPESEKLVGFSSSHPKPPTGCAEQHA